MFPNSYHLVFMAVCREVFDPFKHTGGLKGGKANAMAELKAKKEDEKAK